MATIDSGSQPPSAVLDLNKFPCLHQMAAPKPPSWLVPYIHQSSRMRTNVPPTWHVVFICPMEDAQRVEIMTKLSTVDKEWTDRPEVEMRRMVEVPWLIDQTAPTSAIFDILREDPVIGVDVRTSIDDSAIIIWRDPINSIPEAARVPIGRANLLLGVAAQGRLSSEYVRILPQPKEHTTPIINAVLPSHLSGLRLEPSTPTLISLVHLSETEQEKLESMIDCQAIIHNWPANQEPCSHAQLYRMFQALKIGHGDNYQAFALFIDEGPEGHQIMNAIGSSIPNFSDPDESKLHIDPFPFEKVGAYWNAAWNPDSDVPRNVPKGPYKYNPAMWELNSFGGEPIVNPDDIPGSLNTSVIFVLEKMTQIEIRKIRSEIFHHRESDEDFMWVDVSDRLASPDMQGLVAYFESGKFANHSPPRYFLAVDRQTLLDAMEPEGEREGYEAIIVASNEACDVWFRDETNRSWAHLSTGYGYYRGDYEETEGIFINLITSNMSWDEMCENSPVVHWSAYRTWAGKNSGESFSRSFGPDGMKTPIERSTTVSVESLLAI